jgi:hypothetical protein
MNKLKAILEVTAQTGQNCEVNKTSAELTAQDDDFQEVKRRKSCISNNTLQRAKKSTKSIRTSTAVKLPPKAMLTCTIFAPLRTTDMDTESTGTENILPENQAGHHQ